MRKSYIEYYIKCNKYGQMFGFIDDSHITNVTMHMPRN